MSANYWGREAEADTAETDKPKPNPFDVVNRDDLPDDVGAPTKRRSYKSRGTGKWWSLIEQAPDGFTVDMLQAAYYRVHGAKKRKDLVSNMIYTYRKYGWVERTDRGRWKVVGGPNKTEPISGS